LFTKKKEPTREQKEVQGVPFSSFGVWRDKKKNLTVGPLVGKPGGKSVGGGRKGQREIKKKKQRVLKMRGKYQRAQEASRKTVDPLMSQNRRKRCRELGGRAGETTGVFEKEGKRRAKNPPWGAV